MLEHRQNMGQTSGKSKSLYQGLSFALILLVTLVSAAVSLLEYLYLSQRAEAVYRDKLTEYSAYLENSLESPLWNIDDELVERIGAAFAANPEVVLLNVRDERSRLVYHCEKAGSVEFSRTVSIRHAAEGIGSVEIGLSAQILEQRNRQLLEVSLIMMVALIVVLLLALRWVLAHLLKNPVRDMVGVADDIVEGKYRQLELPQTYAEFEPVVCSLKAMSDVVADREETLRQANDKLTLEIGERKQAEEALKKSEELWQFALEGAGDGVWDWDMVTNQTYFSRYWKAMIGYEEYEFENTFECWSRHLHPEDLSRTQQTLLDYMAGKVAVYRVEFRMRCKDGSWKWILARGKIVERSADGHPLRMIGTHSDISVRKQAEEELRLTSLYVRSLIEASLDPLVTISREGKISDVNQATEEATGRSRAELIGTDFSEYFTEPEKARAGYREVFAKGFVTDYPLAIHHRDGRIMDVLYNASVYRNQDGEVLGVFAAARDITERKRAEEELIRYKNHLEDEVQQRTSDLILARNAADAANRAKSVFLASMSHELRTPMNAILGFSSMMRKDEQLTVSQREKLDIINRSGEHLLSLINDVLEVAKIEAGRVQLEHEPFDLGGMVRDVIDMMQIRAQEKGLMLIVDQSSEFPRFIKGDEGRLRQMLINLVGNAVKFTREGGVTVRLGTRENLRAHLLIEVEDTGIGMREEDLQRIFEPFVQLSEVVEQKGTGLGLTITRQFAQLMGGTLAVESKLGVGSVFRLDLPLDAATEEEVTKTESETFGEVVGLVPDQPAYRILIVEDQRENSLLLEKLMADIGLQTRLAENGEQAVEQFQGWKPDLIWMDRRMPVMDGVEATRRIRALPGGQAVKIVAVTASAFKEQRDEMLAAGMDDFVRKPYRFDEIYECLARQLGVRYLYAGVAAKEDESRLVLTREMLEKLPEALRTGLCEALESLDGDRIEAVLHNIAAQDEVLHRILVRMVANFDYAPILNACGRMLNGQEQSQA